MHLQQLSLLTFVLYVHHNSSPYILFVVAPLSNFTTVPYSITAESITVAVTVERIALHIHIDVSSSLCL